MASSSELQRKIEALYRSARELDPAKRASFLGRACAGDDLLRQGVEALLSMHEQATATSTSSVDAQSKPQPDIEGMIG